MKRLLLHCLLFLFPVIIQAQTLRLQSGTFTLPIIPPGRVQPLSHEQVAGKYYRYILFRTIPTEEQKARFREHGVALFNYLPDNIFMACIPDTLKLARIDDGNIVSIFPIKKEYKLDPLLTQKKLPSWALRERGYIELTVFHFPDLDNRIIGNFLTYQGAQLVHSDNIQGTHKVILRIADIGKIAALPYVYYLEPVNNEHLPDNLTGKTSHRSNAISTSYTSGLHYDGTGVTVALNDDGVIGPHIDYQGRLLQQFTATNNGNHGDHCAGTIFGAGNINPTTRGMAHGAGLLVYRVMGSATGYQAFDSIYLHYNSRNVRITSTSYSDGSNTGYTNLARTMDIQLRTLPQLSHVFSAGNSGTLDYNYGAGAGWGNITGGHKQAKNVIAVGNLDYLDALNNSSSRGPAKDGRIKPDICAVGTNVNSTVNPNTYSLKTGTSMACPGVAGTLAQLYQAYQSVNSGTNPKGALMKAVIMNTADDLGNPGPDYKHGWGRINARRAANIILNNQHLTDSVTQGVIKTHTITVPANTAELRVMVYWNDYEATAGAAKALVNNLNMQLLTPSSQTILPWILNPTPSPITLNSNAVPGVDTLNNVEQVTVPNPAAGTYTVSIAGAQVPQGPQHYFIVYEFVPAAITVIYPSGGESLVPNVQETIRWDAYGNSAPFTVEYSTNNGGSWTILSSNVAATQRHYNWNVPATVTGEALVRVRRGTLGDQSDTAFSIIGVPTGLIVNWVCVDSLQVSYNTVSGATGYIVTILGNKYMDAKGFSTTNSCVVTNVNTFASGWFSVQAVGPNGCVGRRALAKTYPSVPFNCVVQTDIAATAITSPSDITEVNCQATPFPTPLTVDIKNNGLAPASNITVSHSVNGSTPISAVFPGPVNAGSTVPYTFASPVVLSVPGVYTIKVWISYPGDAAPANDTVTIQKLIAHPSIYGLPYYQDFQSFPLCDTSANCGLETCVLPAAWMNLLNNVDDSIDWRTNSGPTPTRASLGTTGPQKDYSPGVDSGKYMYLESSDCYGKEGHLVSACLNLTGFQMAYMNFACHMFGSTMGELHVDVLNNGSWLNDVIPPLTGNQGNSWNVVGVPLTAFLNKIISIRFRGITGTGPESDIAIDGVMVSGTLAVKDTDADWVLDVFPNPSEGLFQVSIKDLQVTAELTVADASGRTVARETLIPGGGTAHTTVDLRHAAAGVYLLSIRTKTGSERRKLMKL